jgi:hypothetical protein
MDRYDIVSYWIGPNHLEVLPVEKRPIATLMNINELEYRASLKQNCMAFQPFLLAAKFPNSCT